MIISITMLDRALRRNILERSYAVAELEQIREQLQIKLRMRQRGFWVLLAMAVVMAGMLEAMIGFDENFWERCAVMAIVDVLALAVVWVLCIGIVKCQFNHIIRKAYPEYAQSLKL